MTGIHGFFRSCVLVYFLICNELQPVRRQYRNMVKASSHDNIRTIWNFSPCGRGVFSLSKWVCNLKRSVVTPNMKQNFLCILYSSIHTNPNYLSFKKQRSTIAWRYFPQARINSSAPKNAQTPFLYDRYPILGSIHFFPMSNFQFSDCLHSNKRRNLSVIPLVRGSMCKQKANTFPIMRSTNRLS